MKNFILSITMLLLALLLIILIINIPKHKATIHENSPWTLVWHDEFNGNKLNTNKWRIKDGGRQGELQYYSPQNIKVKGGNLIIKSLYNNYFSSGWVDTDEKFSFTYGKIEIRGKLPYGKGLWPAYWLVPSSMWPPEIDIMENLGENITKFTTDVHWNPENDHECIEYQTDEDLSKDFHIYSVEWEPNEIRFYFDNLLIRTFNNSNNNVPNIPHIIVLNTAIGGDWGGNPDESTKFPQYNYIDYVRVWQKK